MATRVRDAVGKPRLSLTVTAVAAASLLATTTVTTAAWTDSEWAGGTVGVGSPGDCATNTLFSSRAAAQQLSGSVLGVDLSTLAGVEGLSVPNTDGAATPVPLTATGVTGVPDAFLSKLPVTVLGDNPVTAALGLGAPVGSLGTYTQWAQAQGSGQARAAAGLVTDQSGAVDVTGTATGAGTAPDSATISLGSILPASLAGITLDVGAVASSSSVEGCGMVNGWPTLAAAPTVTREYGVASLDLGASVPSLVSISEPTTTATGSLPGMLPGLEDDLVRTLDSEVAEVLGSLGLVATTTAVELGTPDVSAVHRLLEEPQSRGAVTLDVNAGRLWVDLAKLPGAGPLNSLMPNSPVVLTAAGITQLQDDVRVLLGGITTQLRAAIDAMTVSATVRADVGLLGSTEILIGGTLGEIRAGTLTPTFTTIGLDLTPLLLGDLRAAVLRAVTTSVVEPTSAIVSNLQATLAPLTTRAATDVGTLLTAVSTLVSIHVNVQPDQPWAGDRPKDVVAGMGEYEVSAVRVGIVNQPELLSLSLGTSTAGRVNYSIS